MNRSTAASLLAAVLMALPLDVAAQCRPDPDGGEAECPLDAPRWVGQFTSISANAMIGGVTAGLTQYIRGGSFSRGFVKGMLGGGMVWAGKLVAAQRFSGSGLAGRELAAVGSSMVRNSGLGQGLLEELVLPVGPVRLYVRPGAPTPVVPKVDVVASAWLAYGIVESELDFDAVESISSGAPVFRTDGKVLRLVIVISNAV
jgi:hypothetical protein